MPRLSRLLLLPLLTACSTAAAPRTPSPAQQPAASSPATALAFAWPLPARATVTERVTKKRIDATIRYVISLAPAAHDGKGRLALRLTDFEFVEVTGQDMSNPAVRKGLETAIKLSSALPTLLIAPKGDFDDITGLDEVVEKLVATMELPPGERQKVLSVMKAPQMIAMMKGRSADFWNVWVGLWAGLSVGAGQRLDLTIPVSLPDGSTLDRPLTIAHHGAADPPGHVRLSFESNLQGTATEAGVGNAVNALLQQIGGMMGQPIPRDGVERLAMTSGGEVITDPATLRPARARMSREITVKLAGQPATTAVEKHEYAFAWAPATPSSAQ